MKRIYFQSVAVSTKMNLASSGLACNLTVNALYDKMEAENIGFKQWPQWLDKVLTQSAKNP
jgi:hypothetical protein